MRNFYLVQAGCLYGNTYYLPYAVGMLAAFALDDEILKQEFSLGRIIYSLEDIDTAIASMEEPSLVGFSNSIWNYEYNLEFAKKLKMKYPDCVIEFGGHHVPPDNSFLNDYDFIDVLIHGKGEEAFRDVLLAVSGRIEYSDIPNISYRDPNGNPHKTQTQAIRICDYPSPYLTGVFDQIISEGGYPFSCVLETNRGCPYNCSYCDWGELNSQVRMFSLERVFAELEWMAANKMEFVYLVDANFGMFARDEQIAQKLVELKETAGYPNRLQVSYAKNEPDRVFRINKLLADHGIGKGATLALQSLSPEVLKNVGRANISKEEYVRRIAQFRGAGISTYTELIIGLPGETLQSFEEGLCEILELGQHSSVTAYHCELLPGSRMSTKEYMEQYGIKTVCTTLDQFHCNDMRNVLSGYSNIVVGTNTMSPDEWIEANFFAGGLQGLHHFGLTQCAAMYVRKELNISYHDFYTALLRFLTDESSVFRPLFRNIRRVLYDFVYNGGPLTVIDGRFGSITWPLEEEVFLACLYDRELFYKEIEIFLRRYIYDAALLSDLLCYQRSVILHPDNNSEEIMLHFAWRDYFNAIMENTYIPLQKRDVMYRFQSPFNVESWPEYAKQIVWYGRRNSRMLYSSSPNTITEV
ncbi:MAG: B12-binding domain-containing radical SAM protein [Oscillospiraceae bacterium]|nr:B12-binding domain-containing radical SAM protein [Oscillospiraceae bacterium]